MRTVSAIGAVAGGALLALQGLVEVRRVGAAVPAPSLVAAGAVAAALAVAAAVRTASSAWRGPPIEPLPRHDLAVCDPADAEAIRAAAQLRGTMGGAGHVHPARLALPALAWLSAAAAALAGHEAMQVAPWLAALVAFIAATLLFPARAFLYREASGARVVLHPASVREALLRSASVRGVAGGERSPL